MISLVYMIFHGYMRLCQNCILSSKVYGSNILFILLRFFIIFVQDFVGWWTYIIRPCLFFLAEYFKILHGPCSCSHLLKCLVFFFFLIIVYMNDESTSCVKYNQNVIRKRDKLSREQHQIYQICSNSIFKTYRLI